MILGAWWEGELPVGPAAAPMTYAYRDKQCVVLAIGGGLDAELIGFALPDQPRRSDGSLV